VLGQPRWRGGVQSMINPIAIRWSAGGVASAWAPPCHRP